MIDIQVGEETPLLVSLNKSVDAEALCLYVYEDGNYIQKNNTFEQIGDLLYKTSLLFETPGYVQIKVMLDEDVVADALLHIKETLKRLIDAQFGNWEIKDKQMIFYKVNGEELMRFDLYDKEGKRTTFGAVRRERVE